MWGVEGGSRIRESLVYCAVGYQTQKESCQHKNEEVPAEQGVLGGVGFHADSRQGGIMYPVCSDGSENWAEVSGMGKTPAKISKPLSYWPRGS